MSRIKIHDKEFEISIPREEILKEVKRVADELKIKGIDLKL